MQNAFTFRQVLSMIKTPLRGNTFSTDMVLKNQPEITIRPHILIVDDEETINFLLQRMLEPEYRVTTANNGAQALTQMANADFDLVLTDIRMPQVDGLQLLQAIRENPATADLPVVMISAIADNKDVVHGLERGANDYIAKPFDRRIVLARVHTQIELKRLIDTQKQANNELKQTQMMRDRFFNMASHDLKSPMNQIRLAQFLLRETLSENPETDKLLDNIEFAVGTMEDIVRDYLEIAAIHSQPLELNLGEVVLEDVLWDVVDQYHINAQKKNIALLVESATGSVYADKRRVIQSLGNLVSNAIKYSPPGSSVILSTEHHGHCCLINVQDEGPGIPEDEHDLLFTAFGKLSTVPTGDESRTGLGLWIVRQLVELQNGTVGVNTPSVGGSTFWMKLPVWCNSDDTDETKPDRNQVFVASGT